MGDFFKFCGILTILELFNIGIHSDINDTKIKGQTVILIPGNKLMSLKNYTSNWCYQKRRRLSVPPILVSTQAKPSPTATGSKVGLLLFGPKEMYN